VNVYPFIEAEKACRRNVKRACELLKVSRAAFYQHLAGPSAREQQDAELAAEITAVHAESKGRYGAPRVHAQLARRGRRHGRKRVARIMRAPLACAAAPRSGGREPPSPTRRLPPGRTRSAVTSPRTPRR
jgi:transposase InsO family protein